jgi:hypothetical protein
LFLINEHYVTKTYGGIGCIDSSFHNYGATWRRAGAKTGYFGIPSTEIPAVRRSSASGNTEQIRIFFPLN